MFKWLNTGAAGAKKGLFVPIGYFFLENYYPNLQSKAYLPLLNDAFRNLDCSVNIARLTEVDVSIFVGPTIIVFKQMFLLIIKSMDRFEIQ